MAAGELRRCVESVDRGCALLVGGSPAGFAGCALALESAIDRLRETGSLLSSGAEADALVEAWRLRRSVRRAAALLENAAAYHHGWSALWGDPAAGYGPAGAPGQVAHPPRLWLEG